MFDPKATKIAAITANIIISVLIYLFFNFMFELNSLKLLKFCYSCLIEYIYLLLVIFISF